MRCHYYITEVVHSEHGEYTYERFVVQTRSLPEDKYKDTKYVVRRLTEDKFRELAICLPIGGYNYHDMAYTKVVCKLFDIVQGTRDTTTFQIEKGFETFTSLHVGEYFTFFGEEYIKTAPLKYKASESYKDITIDKEMNVIRLFKKMVLFKDIPDGSAFIYKNDCHTKVSKDKSIVTYKGYDCQITPYTEVSIEFYEEVLGTVQESKPVESEPWHITFACVPIGESFKFQSNEYIKDSDKTARNLQTNNSIYLHKLDLVELIDKPKKQDLPKSSLFQDLKVGDMFEFRGDILEKISERWAQSRTGGRLIFGDAALVYPIENNGEPDKLVLFGDLSDNAPFEYNREEYRKCNDHYAHKGEDRIKFSWLTKVKPLQKHTP